MTTGRRAIFSPTMDALCIGGLSFAALAPILIQQTPVQRADLATPMLVLAAAINSPHIVASYLLVYRSKSSVRDHPWASIAIPILLFTLCVTAVVLRALHVTGAMVDVLVLLSAIYTPVHFVGQSWGMMATYSALEGRPFDERERKILKAAYWLLIVWNMLFAVTFHHGWPQELPGLVEPVYRVASLAMPASIALGVVGLFLHRRRTGLVPPLRVLIPWAAIYVWYSMAARHPETVFLVQICHALQYVPFPLRVTMNRAVAAGRELTPVVKRSLLVFVGGALLFLGVPWLLPFSDLPRTLTLYPGVALGLSGLYLIAIVLTARTVPKDQAGEVMRQERVHALSFWLISTIGGCIGYWFFHRLVKSVLFLGDVDGEAIGVSVMVAVFLNVHHYVSDGVLWKLRNPELRRDLFAHVKRDGAG